MVCENKYAVEVLLRNRSIVNFCTFVYMSKFTIIYFWRLNLHKLRSVSDLFLFFLWIYILWRRFEVKSSFTHLLIGWFFFVINMIFKQMDSTRVCLNAWNMVKATFKKIILFYILLTYSFLYIKILKLSTSCKNEVGRS